MRHIIDSYKANPADITKRDFLFVDFFFFFIYIINVKQENKKR